MSQTIRTFIAIELSDRIRSELAGIQNKIRKADADVKWTDPENIHVTLKFLGDMPQESIPAIEQTLDDVAKGHTPFNIVLGNLGAFPNTHAPRIIWAGIAEGADKISGIASLIEDRLMSLGIKKEEREFSAHITLGRARSPRGKVRLSQAITSTVITPGHSQKVSQLTLFQSQLTASGPIYSAIHHSELRQG